jgi:DNA (cytosine-5)-methyltransferase 1
MTALSLFSGIGGIDLAAEAAGIRTVAMCEKAPFCRAVLRKHWPDVPIFEDVKKLRVEDIGEAVDLIFGGPPCQPVSVAGRRRGQDDERYLWGEVFRLVADIMPRFCVFENVPGILSIAADEICQELERIGYSVGICCFEAAAVGAWHRRARVFFIAHSRRRLCEGGSVAGEIRGEPETRPSSDVERSGGTSMADPESERRGHGYDCADIREAAGKIDALAGSCVLRGDVSYAARCRRGQGAEISGRREEGIEQGAWNRSAFTCSNIPDAYSEGEPQQERLVGEKRGRSRDSREDAPDTNLQRREEQQPSFAENGKWASFGSTECSSGRRSQSRMGGVVDGAADWMDGYWDVEPNIPRIARGVKDRVNRLRALGNAVVWQQIYPIFRAIAEIEASDGTP